jgi:hypothetical protein
MKSGASSAVFYGPDGNGIPMQNASGAINSSDAAIFIQNLAERADFISG